MEPEIGERRGDILGIVQGSSEPRFVDIHPSCPMFSKSAQDPRIVPTLMAELDGFRIFLECVQNIRNMVPVAFQSDPFTLFIFAGELEWIKRGWAATRKLSQPKRSLGFTALRLASTNGSKTVMGQWTLLHNGV